MTVQTPSQRERHASTREFRYRMIPIFILSCLITLAGSVCTYGIWPHVKEKWANRKWENVRCTILASQIETIPEDLKGHHLTRYRPRFSFAYSYGGQEYQTSAFERDDSWALRSGGNYERDDSWLSKHGGDRKNSEDVVSRLPVGSVTTCTVNASRPNEAYIVAPPQEGFWDIWVLAAVFFFVIGVVCGGFFACVFLLAIVKPDL